MDASTLEFPRSALSARRPDGMIEYAQYDFNKNSFRLCWDTVIDGNRHAYRVEDVTKPALDAKFGGDMDKALEAGRDNAIAHFQQLEAGPEPQ